MGDNTSKKEKNLQSRKWLLTINNPEEHGFSHDVLLVLCDSLKADYFCLCDEVGLNENTPHTHLFIYRDSPIRFSRVQKLFYGAHIDYCHGTIQENRDYIRKEGKYLNDRKKETNKPETFYENCTPPEEKQGKRNDLVDLYDMIKEGKSNYEILETNPEYMSHLSLIDKTRETLRFEQFKTIFRKLDVTYISGDTETGKTRGVLENYPLAYRVTDYDHPFDFYSGEDCIIFDEFRMDFKIGAMLNFLDGYACQLPCRYNQKIACYTKVYVISNITLFEQYPNVKKEQSRTYDAFLRRFHHFEYHERKNDGSVKVHHFDDIKLYKEFCYSSKESDFIPLSKKEEDQMKLFWN